MKRLRDPRGAEDSLALAWRARTSDAYLPSPSAPLPAVWQAARAGWREAAKMLEACGAFEWVALAYLAISGLLLLVFYKNLPSAPLHVALRVGVACLLLGLSAAARRWPLAALRFVRHWYPHAFFLFCFEELASLVHLVFPGWFDRWLIALDYWLVGVHPTVWLEQFARPGLNDFMQVAYMTYFFYLIVLGGLLYARAEYRAFWTVMTGSIVAYAMGYVIAIFFPIESPYHALAALQRVELTGGAATALIGLVERFGRVHGAAFPSAHVSGSLVALLGAWRYRQRLFWIFLPWFLCMLVSTVYGRYHYIADVLAGLVVGGIGFWLGDRLMQRRGACPPPPEGGLR